MRETIMKHKIIIIIAAAVLLAAIGFFAGMAAKSSLADSSKDIGVEAAKEIALASVGVSAEKATFTKAVLDEGKYEIDFYTASNEYDFEVNAATGAIVDRETSQRDLSLPVQEQAATSEEAVQENTEPAQESEHAVQNNNDDSVIGVSAAKEIALNHAGVSGASFMEASLDYDDGMRIYDLEFTADNKSYDYEIDAYTGDIIEYDVDRFGFDD